MGGGQKMLLKIVYFFSVKYSLLVVPVYVVFAFQSKSSYAILLIFNRNIWFYISELHYMIITHHYCADRLNPD